MINFLLKKDDLRSQLLRKFFTFKIVPMLNPDGVHNGNYRMDMLGQNLNRYYNNTCTLSKQYSTPSHRPSIFALKSLM
jgi:murein tripeptide amidase MpaA